MFEQILEDVEELCRDIAGIYMKYDELKDVCNEYLKDEDYISLFFDRSKNESEGKCNTHEETNPSKIVECLPETNRLYE